MIDLAGVVPAIQAGEEVAAEEAPAQYIQQVTTTFSDEFGGIKLGETYQQEQFTVADANSSATLANFLSRPVRIDTFTWQETDPLGVIRTISPWSLFFNDPSIKYKLNNFSFISCNLKLKIIVNASPFYFGALRACYQPLPVFKPSTVGAANVQTLVNYSQQPGIWISPMTSEGGDLDLPFLYQKDYLSVQRLADFTNMGTLRFVNYAALDSANGATGVGVSVQVYAWAEDVILSGPSVGLALQADEYGDGVVSAPASAVARIAGSLRGVPIIGKFATATEMGAKAIGGIAKLFGFTNVPVIEDTKPYRPSPFPQFASPEIGYPVEKLTLDPKNELTIDNSTVGTTGEDPLAIEGLVKRESYLTYSTWSTTSPVDTPLFTTRVTPWMFDINGTRGNAGCAYYMTPQAMVASNFAHWRGDIIFHFKVICSKYHKGRLRISYDPVNPAVQTTGDTGSMTFNKIVDIGEESEFEIRIPYHQALSWLRTNTSLTANHWSTSNVPALTANTTDTNGILSIKVLTLLTAPIAASAVSLLVFVKAADNLEFANPTLLPRLSPFTVQGDSGETSNPDASQDIRTYVPGGESIVDMDRYRINFGECVRSLRPLMRRATTNEIWFQTGTSAANYVLRSVSFRYPKTYGYDPNTTNQAKGVLVPATTFPFNYSPMNPYSMVSNCFIGQRGAMMWHLVPDSIKPLSNFRVSRRTDLSITSNSPWSVVSAGATQSALNASISTVTPAGCAVVNCSTTNGLSVSIPNYTQYKFQSTRPNSGTVQYSADLDRTDGGELESWITDYTGIGTDIPPETVKIHTYFGIGTDYNVLFFLNVPTMYAIPTLPTPV
nr:MAG: hypothetical protein 2 [Marnaviridae sp.]